MATTQAPNGHSPSRSGRLLLLAPLLTVCVAAPVACGPASEGERALAALEARGAKVQRDEKAPDRPAVRLNLGFTPVADADLKDLERLTSLIRLDLTRTKVGDAGLAHAKGLTGLQ